MGEIMADKASNRKDNTDSGVHSKKKRMTNVHKQLQRLKIANHRLDVYQHLHLLQYTIAATNRLNDFMFQD